MTFCLPLAYYREYRERKEREEKGLEEPLLEVRARACVFVRVFTGGWGRGVVGGPHNVTPF